MFSKMIVLIGFVWDAAGFAANREQTLEFDGRIIQKIVVESAVGDVNVVGNAKDKIVLEKKVTLGKEDCIFDAKVDGTRLVVSVQSEDSEMFSTKDCEINLSFSVKPEHQLEIRTGSGDVDVKRVSGQISAKTGSGDIQVVSSSTKVLLQVGSGDIEVTHEGDASADYAIEVGSGNATLAQLIGNVDAMSGSGDLDMSWKKITGTESIKVKTGSGDATLRFPKDALINPEVFSGSGNVNNEIGSSPKGVKIIGMVGSGDVKIKKL